MNTYQRPDDKRSGWHLLWDGPYRMGADNLYEAADLYNDPEKMRTRRNRVEAAAKVALGVGEMVPGVNIPIAMLDRAYLRGKHLIGTEPLWIHGLYHSMICCMGCIEPCLPKKQKPKED